VVAVAETLDADLLIQQNILQKIGTKSMRELFTLKASNTQHLISISLVSYSF